MAPGSQSGRPSETAVAILTFNGYEAARTCLLSLRVLKQWPLSVVIVDNGSQEPEGERLAHEFGGSVAWVRLDPNRQVPGGYNAGLQWASDHGYRHVLLMNNDTIVTDPEMLTCLLDASSSDDIAAVAPMSMNADGSIYSAGGTLSWWTGRSGHQLIPSSSHPYQVPWLDGPCLLVSLEISQRLGGFADVFGMYWEDVDWSVRATRAGFRCIADPRTGIVHLRGGTNSHASAQQMDLRNRILFMRRNGSLAANIVSTSFFLWIHIPAFLFRRASDSASLVRAWRAVWFAVAWNVRDARARRSWRRPSEGPRINGVATK